MLARVLQETSNMEFSNILKLQMHNLTPATSSNLFKKFIFRSLVILAYVLNKCTRTFTVSSLVMGKCQKEPKCSLLRTG